jgi:hypothetical protein
LCNRKIFALGGFSAAGKEKEEFDQEFDQEFGQGV